ncbi:hypothetical protein JMJ35_001512 [Cladonia borealis]|uniref:Uncharacterized protein n=1 Tax=Cladonia borealis TaxID=184061 RepID=A0AA39R5Y0_9LECA|nr:hypothetical protein JMJ35_001512 [Cladonia borealis]
MALLLAPYNNAMRLGQGIMAQKEAKPSAWTRQRETITDERATDDVKAKPITSPVTAAQAPHGIAEIEKAPSKPPSSANDKPAQSSTEELDESKATHEDAETEEVDAGDQADAEANDTSAATVKSKSDSLDHIESQDLESDEPGTASESQDVPETTSGGDEAVVKQPESSVSEAEAENGVVKTADPDDNSRYVLKARETVLSDLPRFGALSHLRTTQNRNADLEMHCSTTDGPAKPRSPSTAAISAQKPSLGAAASKRRPVRSSSMDAAKPSKPDVTPQHKAEILPKIEKARASEGPKEDPADAIARKKEEEATLAAERTYQKQLEKETREE